MHPIKAGAVLLLLFLMVAGAQALTIKNRSYTDVNQDIVSDRIVTTIGDEFSGTTTASFRPYLNRSRWGEVWYSVIPTNLWPASGTVTVTVNNTGSKISVKRGNITLVFYNVSPQTIPEGGFENDVVYAAKPLNYTVNYTLKTSGVNFYLQDALNRERGDYTNCNETVCQYENGRASYRPENVVGSYAIWSNLCGDYTAMGGKNYRTGKVGHLYPPEIWDSGTNRTRAGLNITGNQMIVTLNRTWMDQAVYPVTLDPIWGDDGAGTASETGWSDGQYIIYAKSNAAPSGGVASNMSIYMDAGSVGQWRSAIYYNSATGNGPTNKQWGLDTRAPVSSGKGWKTDTNVSGQTVTNGNTSWFLARVSIPSGTDAVYRDNTGGIGYYDFSGNIRTAWAASDSFTTTNPYSWAIYVAFAPAGGAPGASFNLTTGAGGKLLSDNRGNVTIRGRAMSAIDASSGTPDSWLWYPAGNRKPAWLNSSSQNPTFTPRGYSGPGEYMLCLMACDDANCDTKCQRFRVLFPGMGE